MTITAPPLESGKFHFFNPSLIDKYTIKIIKVILLHSIQALICLQQNTFLWVCWEILLLRLELKTPEIIVDVIIVFVDVIIVIDVIIVSAIIVIVDVIIIDVIIVVNGFVNVYVNILSWQL